MKKRRCRTCKKLRPASAYADEKARTCNDCRTRTLICPGCGKQYELDWQKPRKTCGDPACFKKVQLGNLQTPKKQPLPATRVCSQCKQCKPLDAKHFWRRGKDNFQYLCKKCSAAMQRDRYKNIPREREMALKRAKAAAERRDKRRREDPEFDAEYRRIERERNKRYYDRTYGKPKPEVVVEMDEHLIGPNLPAAPLLEAIQAYAKRNGLSKEEVAERIGTNPRRINDWENKGDRAIVRESLADKILLVLHLNWWDIWDPADYPRVAKRLAA